MSRFFSVEVNRVIDFGIVVITTARSSGRTNLKTKVVVIVVSIASCYNTSSNGRKKSKSRSRRRRMRRELSFQLRAMAFIAGFVRAGNCYVTYYDYPCMNSTP